jgi:hypothetical protein
MVSVKNLLLVSEGPGVPQELGPAVFYMNYPHRILIRWSVLGFAVCVVSFFFCLIIWLVVSNMIFIFHNIWDDPSR